MRVWWSKLLALFRRRHLDEDLRAEMESHLQMEVEDRIDRGMSADAARARVAREFGNTVRIQESSRESWAFLTLENLLQDLRYAVRVLRKSPAFTLTALTVAALGVGANTAAFTLLNHVWLRPLPFAQPDHLVTLVETQSTRGITRSQTTPPNFQDWRTMNRSFTLMGAYIPTRLPINLSGLSEPVPLDGIMTGADVFDVLGVQPAVGRGLTTADESDAAESVVLLADEAAAGLFGTAERAIGQSVRLDERTYTIVGVMPAGFAFPYREIDLWMPLRPGWIGARSWTDRSNRILNTVARLKPGVTLEQARADMSVVSAQLAQSYPKQNQDMRAEVLTLREVIAPESVTQVVAVFGAAFCLLLIACTNLANLLFAHVTRRKQEMAVRGPRSGAPRSRLMHQILTESLVLAVGGGALGLLLALVITPSLALMVPATLPVGATPEIDWRVFVFAAVATVGTCVTFGVGPAWRAVRAVDLNAIRARTSAGSKTQRLRSALVVAEVVGSVALLVGTGLLLKAMWRVQAVDPGFRAEGAPDAANIASVIAHPCCASQFLYEGLERGASAPRRHVRRLHQLSADVVSGWQPRRARPWSHARRRGACAHPIRLRRLLPHDEHSAHPRARRQRR